MALPVPNLDDRHFQDIVDEAKRLIPQYCPEWTNHNLSDPGVALIELFAWMTEMSLFRLNQMPDVYYTRFLNLIGIEPFPPAAARAELTFWLAGAPEHAVEIPAGTQVATEGSGAETYVFSTIDDLVLTQPKLIGALTAIGDDYHTDVWEDLEFERTSVTVFPSDPLTPGSAFYLGFSGPLAGNVVRLDVDASLEGIGVDPSRPPLRWEVWADDAWIESPVHEDTTGGLNREGAITLLVPPIHEPMTLGGTRAFWVRAVLVEAAINQPTYQASPQVRSIRANSLGGSVAAEHSDVADAEFLGVSSSEPGQTFQASHWPVLPRKRGETVTVTGDDGEAEPWTEVADFSGTDQDDKHFVWDSAIGEIRFGPRVRYPDGSSVQTGAVPPDGAEIRTTNYRYGGGRGGNVGSNTLTALRTAIPFVDRVTNLRPATGGVDAESVENAKLRGPQTVRTGQRAVTADDFERLTMEADAAVARVRCLPPVSPGDPVRILIVPKVDRPSGQFQLDDFALTERLVGNVMGHLDERRILGSRIEVGTPFYQGITATTLITALPGRPETLVRQRALDALHRFVNPFTGGPDGQGWAFDADLNAASVFQLLATIDGVDRVDEVLFFEYDLRNNRRLGRGVEMIRLAEDSLFLSAGHKVVVR